MHARATLHPPSFASGGGPGFLPMTVGDHVSIGEGSVVRSASIGLSVIIGRDCTLGERSILKDCCEILPGAVVPNDQVVSVAFLPLNRLVCVWCVRNIDACSLFIIVLLLLCIADTALYTVGRQPGKDGGAAARVVWQASGV